MKLNELNDLMRLIRDEFIVYRVAWLRPYCCVSPTFWGESVCFKSDPFPILITVQLHLHSIICEFLIQMLLITIKNNPIYIYIYIQYIYIYIYNTQVSKKGAVLMYNYCIRLR